MSSAGQILGGIVGGAIGFAFQNPWLGAQIGMTIGGYLDPGKGPSSVGPRLDDLTVQSSSYGAPLARVYGQVSVVGNVIWLENNRLKETIKKTKTGGKGGYKKAKATTYSYSATFAVALCKGPIVAIRRLWIRADLVYDAGSTDPATIAASNQAQAGWTLYTGTDTQTADPRLQATLGAANTPAWRGLAYLVFHDLELAKYGNSLVGTQIKAEVVTTALGSSLEFLTGTRSNDSWTNSTFDGTYFCTVNNRANTFSKSSDGLSWVENAIPLPDRIGPYELKADPISGTILLGGNGNNASGALRRSTDHGDTWTSIMQSTWAGSFGILSIGWGVGGKVLMFAYNSSFVLGLYLSSDYGLTWAVQTFPVGLTNQKTPLWAGDRWVVSVQVVAHQYAMYTSPTGLSGTWSLAGSIAVTNIGIYLPFFVYHAGAIMVLCTAPGILFLAKSVDAGVTWTTHAYSTIGGQPQAPFFFSDGEYVWRGSPGYLYYSADGETWTSVSDSVLANTITKGTFGNGISAWFDNSSPTIITLRLTKAPSFGDQSIALSAIVSAECLSSGLLTAGDIDVAALTSRVRGYRIGSLGSIRSAVEPLQAAWPFDVVQRGYKLTFKPRGGAAVGTIDAADLDARGDDQGAGVQITRTREVDSQLPRTLTIRYLDSAREYDAGSQYAERLSSATVRESVLDLPIVLNAAEAAGKAEVLLYAAWLARLQVAFSLPAIYLPVEPADVVTLPTPEGPIVVRLVDVNYTSDGRVECRAALEHPAVYTPVALGAAPSTTGPTTLTPLGPATYALLDIPRISSVQDGVGFPVAMCGSDASWPGGVLMRSADGGATWDEPLVFSPPGATIGTAANSLGSVESRLVDAASQLTVTLVNGSLSSVSELSMLGGANHFAYGAQGRWEIIAARSCTLQSGSTYILSNMLRGRFGTEWAMALHAAGDTVVLLDSADLQVLPLSNGDIGAARLYRAITSGRDFSTDSDRAMTYAGANLKPLSPVYLNGSRHPSTNDWALEWLRRTRVGGEWRGGVGAALGEASEAYEIEVYADGSYTTVKRTMSASTPACAYPSADQVSDFGANQATLYLKVYQRSAIVGRGYPLTTSITR